MSEGNGVMKRRWPQWNAGQKCYQDRNSNEEESKTGRESGKIRHTNNLTLLHEISFALSTSGRASGSEWTEMKKDVIEIVTNMALEFCRGDHVST